MMLRLVTAVALAVVISVLLYAPANHNADHFLGFVVAEHQVNIATWGSHRGDRVLARTEWLRGEAVRNRLPGELGKPIDERKGAYADHTVAGRSSSDLASRLMNTEYFRSMDALLVLALYRVAIFIELLPLFVPLVVIAIVDGIVDRARRAKEFVPHSPGLYGLFVVGLLLSVCSLLVLFSVPVKLNPLLMVSAVVIGALSCGRAIAHFLKHA